MRKKHLLTIASLGLLLSITYEARADEGNMLQSRGASAPAKPSPTISDDSLGAKNSQDSTPCTPRPPCLDAVPPEPRCMIPEPVNPCPTQQKREF